MVNTAVVEVFDVRETQLNGKRGRPSHTRNKDRKERRDKRRAVEPRRICLGDKRRKASGLSQVNVPRM
jgi:hypothetical protein